MSYDRGSSVSGTSMTCSSSYSFLRPCPHHYYYLASSSSGTCCGSTRDCIIHVDVVASIAKVRPRGGGCLRSNASHQGTVNSKYLLYTHAMHHIHMYAYASNDDIMRPQLSYHNKPAFGICMVCSINACISATRAASPGLCQQCRGQGRARCRPSRCRETAGLAVCMDGLVYACVHVCVYVRINICVFMHKGTMQEQTTSSIAKSVAEIQACIVQTQSEVRSFSSRLTLLEQSNDPVIKTTFVIIVL